MSNDEDDVFSECTQYAVRDGTYCPVESTDKTLPSVPFTILVHPDGTPSLSPTPIPDNDYIIQMADRVTDEVVADIEKFWTLREVYDRLGVVYKRGVLLYGEPGTGKSTTLNAVMSAMLERFGVVVVLEQSDPADLCTLLKKVRQVEPDRPIVVVMEDLDSVISSYGTRKILSLMDGENQIDNVCYIATTNYLDELPDTVKNRPSRFDRVFHVGLPSAEARRTYLLAKGIDEADIFRWIRCTEGFSVAHMKALVIDVQCFGYDLETSARHLRSMNNSSETT